MTLLRLLRMASVAESSVSDIFSVKEWRDFDSNWYHSKALVHFPIWLSQ